MTRLDAVDAVHRHDVGARDIRQNGARTRALSQCARRSGAHRLFGATARRPERQSVEPRERGSSAAGGSASSREGAAQSSVAARSITTWNSATLPSAKSKISAARSSCAACHAHEDRNRHALANLTLRAVLLDEHSHLGHWHFRSRWRRSAHAIGLRNSTSSASSVKRAARASGKARSRAFERLCVMFVTGASKHT